MFMCVRGLAGWGWLHMDMKCRTALGLGPWAGQLLFAVELVGLDSLTGHIHKRYTYSVHT